jgi:hypothetical protein
VFSCTHHQTHFSMKIACKLFSLSGDILRGSAPPPPGSVKESPGTTSWALWPVGLYFSALRFAVCDLHYNGNLCNWFAIQIKLLLSNSRQVITCYVHIVLILSVTAYWTLIRLINKLNWIELNCMPESSSCFENRGFIKAECFRSYPVWTMMILHFNLHFNSHSKSA